MERTESKVVQVAPDWENPKIEEMQQFGWSLQNRQEMEQKGEAYGRPSYMAEFTGTYVIKTTVTRFVKLHFARSLNMPNLDKIKQLEAQYEALQFPGKASYTGPGCFTAFFAVSLIAGIQSPVGRQGGRRVHAIPLRWYFCWNRTPLAEPEAQEEPRGGRDLPK